MNLYEIAEQCNCWLEDTGNLVTDDIDLERFADLVRADERKVWAYEFAGMGEWLCVNIIEGKLGETK